MRDMPRCRGCKYIDEILVYDTEADLLNLIQTQTFHIRFLSEEYKNVDVTGKQYCMDHDIEIHYHLRRHQYSTTELRNRVYELEKAKREETNIKDIQQYSPEILKKYSIQTE
jgi:glycerol-3-phosphate cytidylyltransferase